jgi:hypothetical protein
MIPKASEALRQTVVARRDEFEDLIAQHMIPAGSHSDKGAWKLDERFSPTALWTDGWNNGWSNWGK